MTIPRKQKTEHQENNRTTSPRNAVADPIDQRVTSDGGPLIKLVQKTNVRKLGSRQGGTQTVGPTAVQ